MAITALRIEYDRPELNYKNYYLPNTMPRFIAVGYSVTSSNGRVTQLIVNLEIADNENFTNAVSIVVNGKQQQYITEPVEGTYNFTAQDLTRWGSKTTANKLYVRLVGKETLYTGDITNKVAGTLTLTSLDKVQYYNGSTWKNGGIATYYDGKWTVGKCGNNK